MLSHSGQFRRGNPHVRFLESSEQEFCEHSYAGISCTPDAKTVVIEPAESPILEQMFSIYVV